MTSMTSYFPYNIPQRIAAARVRRDVIFSDCFIANLLLSVWRIGESDEVTWTLEVLKFVAYSLPRSWEGNVKWPLLRELLRLGLEWQIEQTYRPTRGLRLDHYSAVRKQFTCSTQKGRRMHKNTHFETQIYNFLSGFSGRGNAAPSHICPSGKGHTLPIPYPVIILLSAPTAPRRLYSCWCGVRLVPLQIQILSVSAPESVDGGRWKCWTWKWRTWNWRTNLQGMKLQDVKMTDQLAGHEIAGHENDGRENICRTWKCRNEIAGHKRAHKRRTFNF